MCENVIGYLFSILNGTDPLLNALPADCPDSSYCFLVALNSAWMQVLKGRMK